MVNGLNQLVSLKFISLNKGRNKHIRIGVTVHLWNKKANKA